MQFCAFEYPVTKLESFNESKTGWRELNITMIPKLVGMSE